MPYLTRRDLLKRSLGGLGTLITLPYLEAFAQGAPPGSLRFCPILVPNGVVGANWRPKAVGPLTELPESLLPLSNWISQICVLGGLDNLSGVGGPDGPGDHARSASTFLTCQRANKSETDIHIGTSLDQVIAASLGGSSRFPSLQICGDDRAGADSGYSKIYNYSLSYSNPTTAPPTENNPKKMFDRVFQGMDHKSSQADIARRLHQRKSVLDFAASQAKSLARRLGTDDRKRLDEYFQSVREVEKRLEIQADLDFNGPSCPMETLNPTADPAFPDRLKLFADILVLAFRCEATRVATFLLAPEGNNRTYPFLGIEASHHTLSHHGDDPVKLKQLAAIDRFHVEILAYFLERLAQVKEGAGTLLDQTLILYGAGLSDGNSHSHLDLPLLLAGAGGRLFKPGHYVRFPGGTPLANLHVRIAQEMGVKLPVFGDSTRALA